MATIHPLPSGNYFIRKTYKGVNYSLTLDYKPKQAEADRLMWDLINNNAEKSKSKSIRTFSDAAEAYIASREPVLSVSTVRGYYICLRALPEWFKDMQLIDINREIVQKVISSMAKAKTVRGTKTSPKTIRNRHGFISAVLSIYKPSLSLNTTLPPAKKKPVYIPVDDDVKRVAHAIAGSRYEIAIILASFALRRSEICALDWEKDVSDGVIHVASAKLQDKDGKWIIQDRTKTPEGERNVIVPKMVTDMIKERRCVYKGYPGSIGTYLERTLKKLGIERFTLHKLRHYYASEAHTLGIPDAYIMEAGGWKSDAVLKNVYRHALKDKKTEMQKLAVEHFETLLVQ